MIAFFFIVPGIYQAKSLSKEDSSFYYYFIFGQKLFHNPMIEYYESATATRHNSVTDFQVPAGKDIHPYRQPF
jgi:hypothetical protein